MSTSDELPLHERRSAAFDGEAVHAPDDDEDRRADAASFATWQALGDELRAVTTPDGLLDDLRRRVLDEVAPTAPIPLPLRVSGRRHLAWGGRIVAAAAVLVVVGVGLAALGSGGGGDDGASSSKAFDTAAMTADAATAAGSGARAATGSTGSTGAAAAGASPAPRDLGAPATLAALAAAFRDPTAPGATAASPTVEAAPTCGTVLATARLAGTPVLVVVAASGPVVVDARTCAFVAPLP